MKEMDWGSTYDGAGSKHVVRSTPLTRYIDVVREKEMHVRQESTF